jgi:predicted TIM-barrel fold metal-dependent hydrolase
MPKSNISREDREADTRIEPHGAKSSFLPKLNAILVIAIVILLIIFAYINIDFSTTDGPDNHEDPGLKVQSIIPSREAGIINGHEHIQDLGQGPKWNAAMDRAGVSTTVMVGSPDATFILRPEGLFTGYKDNNEELFKLVDKYPDRYIAFPTIYTYDDDKLDLLDSYIKRGALGIKLFTGHFAVFYEDLGPLDIETMYPIYEYCERNKVPIIWHVHLGKEHLRKQFEKVMEDFPDLICNIPHFMLSSINLWQTEGEGRLRYYLETYDNLYTDVSFGYWAQDGLWRISNHTESFRKFIIEFQDRFTFGTDMVCTKHPRKDVEWIANMTKGYVDILETEYFNLTVKFDIEGDFNGDDPGTHSGLNLTQDVLDKIYYDNMVKFLNCRKYNVDLSVVINESKLKFDTNATRSTNDDGSGTSTNGLIADYSSIIAVDERCVQYN